MLYQYTYTCECYTFLWMLYECYTNVIFFCNTSSPNIWLTPTLDFEKKPLNPKNIYLSKIHSRSIIYLTYKIKTQNLNIIFGIYSFLVWHKVHSHLVVYHTVRWFSAIKKTVRSPLVQFFFFRSFILADGEQIYCIFCSVHH